MDEMNNNNVFEAQLTQENKDELTSSVNSFANNDDPNEGNTYYGYNTYSPSGAPVDSGSLSEERDNVGKGKFSMIFGIISGALVELGVALPIAVILGIIAIISALKAKKEAGRLRGMAIAGLVCGIIGTVKGLIALLSVALVLVVYAFYFIIVIMFALGGGGFSGEVTLGLQNLLSLML